jgi:predicted transglutaminase-like cysteine proteinase
MTRVIQSTRPEERVGTEFEMKSMVSASAAQSGLNRGVGFWTSLAWSGLLLAGVLYIADPIMPFSSFTVPTWFLAADSAVPGSFAEIKVGEVGARHDGSAADDTEGAQLFGMETDSIPEGELSDKWRRVEAEITKDFEIIAHCQAGNPCPPPAQKLIDLSLEGAVRSTRARVGVINRAVDLAISPLSDAKKWGVQDHWSDPFETLQTSSGDCEDYAFVKYAALLAAGLSKDAVKIVVLRNRWPNEEHAVVAVRVDQQWLILDNRTLALVRDTDVVRAIPEFVLDDRGVRRFIWSNRNRKAES